MDDTIIHKLYQMESTKLIKIIQAALLTMDESTQISFIAKYIDAKISLDRLGLNDSNLFLEEVEDFCLSCLNREYYSDEEDIEDYFNSESYYDYEWDEAEFYSNTEWAKIFSKLFKLSIFYMQSDDFDTAYNSTTKLLSCLKEMRSNSDFLGTDEPMSYIATDWKELFSMYYKVIFQYKTDLDKATQKAFKTWLDFGSICNEGFLENIKDINVVKPYILGEIRNSSNWEIQQSCFNLLEQLYNHLNEPFDKSTEALVLVESNVYFYFYVIEGMYELEQWVKVIEISHIALPKIEQLDLFNHDIETIIKTNLMIVDAYENISDFKNAYEICQLIFQNYPSFELYKRCRPLAEKTFNVHLLLLTAEEVLSTSKYAYNNLLRNIYSYEGEIDKIINIANSEKTDSNYYDRKYIAVSLIYRAINNNPNLSKCLTEYLLTHSSQDGINDMILYDITEDQQTELLMYADELLRGIIQFHIDAANRSRYSKATYYMCVLRDVFIFIKKEDDFKQYFQNVIHENSRRPALRDEMKIVYGEQAVTIKKSK